VPTESVLYDHAKLRAWREESGKSPTLAAAENGISYVWLDRIEKGRPGVGTPRLALLAQLAAYYGHQLHELIPPGTEAAS
jgi:transcriptional regulator with XRE-family HTH domain